MNITTQLAGKVVREVWRNGTTLVIRCEDGYEMQIGWTNPDTGAPVNGQPIVLRAGKHIIVGPTGLKPGKLVEIPHRREAGL